MKELKGIKSRLTFIDEKSDLENKKSQKRIFATVKFMSDIISVKKDKDDKIEGNPRSRCIVTDQWKF